MKAASIFHPPISILQTIWRTADPSSGFLVKSHAVSLRRKRGDIIDDLDQIRICTRGGSNGTSKGMRETACRTYEVPEREKNTNRSESRDQRPASREDLDEEEEEGGKKENGPNKRPDASQGTPFCRHFAFPSHSTLDTLVIPGGSDLPLHPPSPLLQ